MSFFDSIAILITNYAIFLILFISNLFIPERLREKTHKWRYIITSMSFLWAVAYVLVKPITETVSVIEADPRYQNSPIISYIISAVLLAITIVVLMRCRQRRKRVAIK